MMREVVTLTGRRAYGPYHLLQGNIFLDRLNFFSNGLTNWSPFSALRAATEDSPRGAADTAVFP